MDDIVWTQLPIRDNERRQRALSSQVFSFTSECRLWFLLFLAHAVNETGWPKLRTSPRAVYFDDWPALSSQNVPSGECAHLKLRWMLSVDYRGQQTRYSVGNSRFPLESGGWPIEVSQASIVNLYDLPSINTPTPGVHLWMSVLCIGCISKSTNHCTRSYNSDAGIRHMLYDPSKKNVW